MVKASVSIFDEPDNICYFITPKCSYKISAGSKFVFAATRDGARHFFYVRVEFHVETKPF